MDSDVLVEYAPDRRLGMGGYAVVWRATEQKSGRAVVIKKILDAFTNDTDAQRVFREIMYQRAANHPSLLKLISLWRAANNKDVYMILPCMDTDLSQALRAGMVTKAVQRQFILFQLLCALKYLHSHVLVHRDIKPMNLLLNLDCELVVCDFGLIRSLGSANGENLAATDQVGSRWYRAPEIMLGCTQYGVSVDMWSVGCVMAELMTGKIMLPGSSNSNQLQRIFEVTGMPTPADLEEINSAEAAEILDMVPRNITQKNLAKLVPRTPELALDLLRQLLKLRASERADTAAALSHPYLAAFIHADDKRRIFMEESAAATDPDSSPQFRTPIKDSIRYPSSVYRDYLYKHVIENKAGPAPTSPSSPSPPVCVPGLAISQISAGAAAPPFSPPPDFDEDAMAA
uniref:Mitogen-activated protein kinase n=1 Tax=Haptolina ericina TaxID=156174 RepID=A0A7S3C1I1_9EUKA